MSPHTQLQTRVLAQEGPLRLIVEVQTWRGVPVAGGTRIRAVGNGNDFLLTLSPAQEKSATEFFLSGTINEPLKELLP